LFNIESKSIVYIVTDYSCTHSMHLKGWSACWQYTHHWRWSANLICPASSEGVTSSEDSNKSRFVPAISSNSVAVAHHHFLPAASDDIW